MEVQDIQRDYDRTLKIEQSDMSYNGLTAWQSIWVRSFYNYHKNISLVSRQSIILGALAKWVNLQTTTDIPALN